MKKAIIIGASSGIGRALAKTLAADGYQLGLVARRLELLKELQQEIGAENSLVRRIDLSDLQQALPQFSELLDAMAPVDLIIISAGLGFINPELEWEKEQQTIAVNVSGFSAIAGLAMLTFIRQGYGHLLNISSLAALRGSGSAPAYNASKAYESNYLQGLRQKAAKLRLPITVTDIQAGFVDTAMAQGEGLFWVASPAEAARQIHTAIRRKASHAYVTRRWRLIAWLFKLLPDALYHQL